MVHPSLGQQGTFLRVIAAKQYHWHTGCFGHVKQGGKGKVGELSHIGYNGAGLPCQQALEFKPGVRRCIYEGQTGPPALVT